jgi:alpha-amylase
MQEYRYVRNGQPFKPYGVAEEWDSARTIDNWVNETNAWNDNPVGAFDFPLRDMLKALCDQYGFSLRSLVEWDTFLRRQPQTAVTFVENHDMRDGDKPIVHDKLLAYSVILTHEGYPCVFWKDYYDWDLGQPGSPHGIAALVRAHEAHAGGATDVLWVDRDLYVMQRPGHGSARGLVYALNNRGDRWNGAWVSTRWRDTAFTPIAWWSGTDRSRPADQRSSADGRAQFWAPPRGYAVYAPEA